MCDVTSRCRAGRPGRPSGLFAPKRRMRPWRKHGCDVLNEQRNDLGNVSQRGFRSSVQTAIASRRRGNERSRPAQRTVVTQHATCTDGAACGRNHAASDGSASSPSLFSSGGPLFLGLALRLLDPPVPSGHQVQFKHLVGLPLRRVRQCCLSTAMKMVAQCDRRSQFLVRNTFRNANFYSFCGI